MQGEGSQQGERRVRYQAAEGVQARRQRVGAQHLRRHQVVHHRLGVHDAQQRGGARGDALVVMRTGGQRTCGVLHRQQHRRLGTHHAQQQRVNARRHGCRLRNHLQRAQQRRLHGVRRRVETQRTAARRTSGAQHEGEDEEGGPLCHRRRHHGLCKGMRDARQRDGGRLAGAGCQHRLRCQRRAVWWLVHGAQQRGGVVSGGDQQVVRRGVQRRRRNAH